MKSPLRSAALLCCFLWLASAVFGKDAPGSVMYWPNQEKPSLKITFGTLRQMGEYGGKLTLVSDVVVQNVSDRPIPHASFTVYMLDKEKVRIGNGVLVFDDLTPGESTKVQFQCSTVGVPVTLGLAAHGDAQGIPNATKIVPLKIISVPAGARLLVDGKDEGITPVLVNLTVGTHQVELSKEGFASATAPVDVRPDEMAEEVSRSS